MRPATPPSVAEKSASSGKRLPVRRMLVFSGVFFCLVSLAPPASAQFVTLEPETTTAGYVSSLLINETPFPGERGYVSAEDTKAAMLAILWVLHGRLCAVPPPYTQWQVAGVKTDRILVVITGNGERRQCEGFFRDASGRPATAPRVQERLRYLSAIANQGTTPGRFVRLLTFAQGLATAYVTSGINGADRFARLRMVGPVEVTGGAFSWMTDRDFYNPGGNFVRIPDTESGSLGGNRFFTLRKSPK